MPGTDGDDQLSLPPLGLSAAGCTTSRSHHQYFWSDEAERHFPERVGLCDSATCLGMGKLSSRMVKLLILGSKSHRFAPWHFLGQTEISTWICRGAKLLIGINTLHLQVWIWSAKLHVLVTGSPSPILCHRFPVAESHRFPCDPPWCETKVRAPTKWSTMLGETGCPTLTP